MSHFEEVKTEYTDPECIVEAIKHAFPWIQEIETATDFEYDGATVVLRGWRGDTTTRFGAHPIKIVARAENKYDLGFALTPEGNYELVADWGGYGYGFLANSGVKDAISNDRSSTMSALSEQGYSGTELDAMMKAYPSRQQAVMSMLSRGYCLSTAQQCVNEDPNLRGYDIAGINVVVELNEQTKQLEAEHQIELVQSSFGSYI
jgi:hypothetical protein